MGQGVVATEEGKVWTRVSKLENSLQEAILFQIYL